MLKNKRGIALIMSVGILAIMSIIATSFAINMRMEQEAALNYLRSVKVKYIAEAGIHKAIADIRSQVKSKKYDDLISYVNSYSTQEQTIEETSTYAVTIGREDEKVNLNALDETDSIWIEKLKDKGLSYTDIAKIIDYRDSDTNAVTGVCTSTAVQSASGDETNAKNAPYVSLEEVKLVIGDTKFESIKNDITIFAPIIRGGLIGKYFVNRTSFSASSILDVGNFKGKVIELGKMKEPTGFLDEGYYKPWGTVYGADGDSTATGSRDGWAEGHDAAFSGGYLAVDWNTGFGMEQFGVIWTGFIYIPEDKVGNSITFYVRSDDGSKLFIDGENVIDIWQDRSMDPEVSGNRTFTYAGWHPIRIEYYDNSGFNGCELRWDALGSKDYVPAEYLGYYPAPYFGRYQPPTFPPTTPDAYNSAGLYKITSTGKIKTSAGTILAEKKITSVAKIFGTWTQTTRAEFYAAWFSERDSSNPSLDDFSDGAIKNVNWMDSCPKNASEDLEAAGYFNNLTDTNKFVLDSLKLGYWDNFDEDVAYSVVMLKGGKVAQINGVNSWKWVDSDGNGSLDAQIPDQYNWASDTTWNVSFGEIADADPADGDYELKIWTPGYKDAGGSFPQDKDAELNSNYYSPDTYSGYDIFVRAWEQDWGQQQQNSSNWGYPPSQRLTNPGQPTSVYSPSWMTGRLTVKENPYVSGQTSPFNYYILLKDGDLDIYNGDQSEFTLNPTPGYVAITFDYNETTKSAVLAAIGVGSNYQSYVNGTAGAGTTSANAAATGIVKLRGINNYAVATSGDYQSWWWPKILSKKGDWFGCDSENESRWDNVRIIYPKGYFVSTPFVSARSTENTNINWGYISWNQESVSSTNITMNIRAGDTLSTSDTGWTGVSNGSALSVTGKQIQYKAELSTSALNSSNYQTSGVTPFLKDVTITYLPQVEIVFWKEETQ